MAFEEFIPDGLLANFKFLNENIPDKKEQKKYFDNWMSKYSKVFKDCDDVKVIEWTIRVRKSLKEIATSATFFAEAQFAFQNSIYSAYYFLSYYSLFHAMLSTLYLDDKETYNNLIEINHSKVINCFESNFSNGKNPIVSFDAQKHFETLKFLREYSSYSMPLNEFFMKNKEIENPRDYLEDDLMQCYQITNLHSIMLQKSCGKHKNKVIKATEDNIGHFYSLFYKINCKRNPINDRYLIDPADACALDELLRDGCKVYGITMDLEHFFDEFRLYYFENNDYGEISENYDIIAQQVVSKMYKALCLF